MLKMLLPLNVLSTVGFVTFVTSSAAHLNISFNCKRPSLLMSPIMIVTKHDWHWLDNMNVPGCRLLSPPPPPHQTGHETRPHHYCGNGDNTDMTLCRVPPEVR